MNPLNNTHTNAFNRITNTPVQNAVMVNDIQENIPHVDRTFLMVDAEIIPYTEIESETLRRQLRAFEKEITVLIHNLRETEQELHDSTTKRHMNHYISTEARNRNISQDEALSLYVIEIDTLNKIIRKNSKKIDDIQNNLYEIHDVLRNRNDDEDD